ncbi:MAG: hypothetical protein HONBIEJF_02174 [Fimbriimonadaceae bacterium]|nr:hypothetical protein [Fimbriimonadaceae bacterium]
MPYLPIERAFPEQVAEAVEAGRPAILPLGAIEWHGDHLPLGTDSLIASHFASLLAGARPGVLFPALNVAMTTLPSWCSLQVRSTTFVAVVDDVLSGLADMGFKTVCLVTGHYAQGQLVELYRAASRAIQAFDEFRAFAATPLQPLARDELLDHAGRYETSQILAVDGSLFRGDRLSARLEPQVDAVLGEDPRDGSSTEGRMLFSHALDAWLSWMDNAEPAELVKYYEQAETQLESYMRSYLVDSWEQAIESWWSTK